MTNKCYKKCSAQNLAETIQNTDFIAKCTTKLLDCLFEYDFGLKDRFCNASELRTSWEVDFPLQ